MDVGVIVGEAAPLSWDRWRHISTLVERLGFKSLFRSDHFFNGIQKDALDVYLSFVMTAELTKQIRFGPLVSPVTFREPVNVGRMAQQLDALSDGRYVQGLGAGWFEPEHHVYGIDFPTRTERYDRLEEAIDLMKELWYSTDGRFDGEYYRIEGTNSSPHPPAGRPPILIGGSGPRRTLRIVAEHAAEWNSTPAEPSEYASAVATLERHCEDLGRDPADIGRSMLLFATIGPDEQTAELATQRFVDMMTPGATLEEAIALNHVPWRGSIEQLVDHLGQLADLGLQEVVFEHFCHEDDTIIEWIATEVAPRLNDL